MATPVEPPNGVGTPGKHYYSIWQTLFEIDTKYVPIKPIGRGAYGIVCSSVNREINEKVAIKKIYNAFENLIDALRTLRELKLLRHLRHENVIALKDVMLPNHKRSFKDVYLVYELMDTDLHQIIKSSQTLSNDHCQYFLFQLLRGLKYLHSANILHRDLKPGNLLINANCDLKICDFGLARTSSSQGQFMTEYVVTRWYRAPELLLCCDNYGTSIDVWSVGCIFAELLGRKPIFPGTECLNQLKLIINILGSQRENDLEFIDNPKARKYIKSLPYSLGTPFSHLYPNSNQSQMEQQHAATAAAKPIHCIVKLGGAAITCKNELETINQEDLIVVSSQLRQAMISGSCHGMDWSKRPGSLEIPRVIDDFSDQEVTDSKKFIVVHGAGSFGHFQASKSGVHKGDLSRPLVKAGFVATRISVTSLNLEIVRALAKEGIPSIGMSPFSCGWSTRERNIAVADVSTVAKAIDNGFVPVLHGDAVLDTSLDCTILSGDVIMRHLAAELKPDYVVFLTDVLGVYDRPPTERDAVLLREIAVRADGSWFVLKPELQDMNRQVDVTVAAHDTTGGMVTKISEAAMIAKHGIDVCIVKAATDHSLRALQGDLKENIPDDWLGTVIRLAK